jgi:hypothetical protein
MNPEIVERKAGSPWAKLGDQSRKCQPFIRVIWDTVLWPVRASTNLDPPVYCDAADIRWVNGIRLLFPPSLGPPYHDEIQSAPGGSKPKFSAGR